MANDPIQVLAQSGSRSFGRRGLTRFFRIAPPNMNKAAIEKTRASNAPSVNLAREVDIRSSGHSFLKSTTNTITCRSNRAMCAKKFATLCMCCPRIVRLLAASFQPRLDQLTHRLTARDAELCRIGVKRDN
jgi:hypothetical protein